MKQVLEQDEANETGSYISSLMLHYPDVVNKLVTKDSLTYGEFKIRLHALTSNAATQHNEMAIALMANKKKRRAPTQNTYNTPSKLSFSKLSFPKQNENQTCTYCKARNFKAEGHIWQNCRKLRRSTMHTLLKKRTQLNYRTQ